jgi:hypothetical protein
VKIAERVTPGAVRSTSIVRVPSFAFVLSFVTSPTCAPRRRAKDPARRTSIPVSTVIASISRERRHLADERVHRALAVRVHAVREEDHEEVALRSGDVGADGAAEREREHGGRDGERGRDVV